MAAGVLRGSGKQYIGAIVSFVSYYIIGLPLGVMLAFKTDLKFTGLWIGMVLASAAQVWKLINFTRGGGGFLVPLVYNARIN